MFLFFMPDAVLIAAAAVPAAALLILVHRADRAEREPPGLLVKLVLMGVVATAIAKALEYAGLGLLNAAFRRQTLLYDLLLYFGVVAFSEEGAKYLLLRRVTWRSPDFNSRYDGVVYAAFVSLGFALWENIGYVLMNGLGTALLRALTAVPGHACFGVFMGCWYAGAKETSRDGREDVSKFMRAMAVVVPALLHGAYDFLAANIHRYSVWLFLAFVSALFALTVRNARRYAREDGIF